MALFWGWVILMLASLVEPLGSRQDLCTGSQWPLTPQARQVCSPHVQRQYHRQYLLGPCRLAGVRCVLLNSCHLTGDQGPNSLHFQLELNVCMQVGLISAYTEC